MKNTGLKILCIIIILSVVGGLCSCSKDGDEDEIVTTNRPVTISGTSDKTIKSTDKTIVAVAPEGEEEIIRYFNKSLSDFRSASFDFVKKDETVLTSCSAGSLETISGATDSYRSTLRKALGDMMGVVSLETTYFAGDDITQAFAIKELSVETIAEAKASANGSQVTVEFKIKQNSADGSDAINMMTGDYMTLEAFNAKISGYGAAADSTSVNIKNVTLKAVIDYSTGNFISVDVGYNSSFSMGTLNLDYVSGGPVRASTRTTIKYHSFKEN